MERADKNKIYSIRIKSQVTKVTGYKTLNTLFLSLIVNIYRNRKSYISVTLVTTFWVRDHAQHKQPR